MNATRLTLIVSIFVLALALTSDAVVNKDAPERLAAGSEAAQEGLGSEQTPVPELRNPDDSRCDVWEQIARAESMLSGVTLDVGDRDISYSEIRNGSKRIFNDPEKEFALAVLDQDRCELEVVTITKRGDELIVPDGWDIEAVERTNGIRWNNWNTEFEIHKPEGSVVVGNIEPFTIAERPGHVYQTSNGSLKTAFTTSQAVEYRWYVPYSRDLHSEEMVAYGDKYLEELVRLAYADLRERKVPSRIDSDWLVTDVMYLHPEMFEQLPVIEHVDMMEFFFEPERSTERVLVLFAANRERAFGYTCNRAGACGALQFTDNGSGGTYSTIRDRYPEAELIYDFEEGAQDHRNVMTAAILLYDNNLDYLVGIFGEDIVHDPKLSEYLAALYNASPARVIPAIADGLRMPHRDWTDFLPSRIKQETGGYIVKLRYLQEADQRVASSN
jgi:hypothetical protein